MLEDKNMPKQSDDNTSNKSEIFEGYESKNTFQTLIVRRLIETIPVILIIAVIILLITSSIRNPGLYVINEETLNLINVTYNATITLLIPCFFGGFGALARLMLSGVRLLDKIYLIMGSALMASFSWIGIKSGVLVSIITPHLSGQNIDMKSVAESAHSFYTLALVAIFVGMFSTNLYLFVNEKVEQLVRKNKNSSSDSTER
ncbi:hypothetical protein ACP6ZN_001040 [Enterobacter cloacae]